MKKFAYWAAVALSLATMSATAAAQRRVTGRVTSTTGEPIGSASITVEGTTIGVYSQVDGTFGLTVPSGSHVLLVRRIGYRRVSVPLGAAQEQVDVRLERDALQLETQIITGTVTSVSSTNAANAVAVVSADQLTKAPTPTIENALQGKVPGALITSNSGAPGGGLQIQLRGVTSINASSSPLYVVDGVLVDNSTVGTGQNAITQAGGGITNNQDQAANRIGDINPEDIESIEVLKGASAGAIYGSKASNGVIVITTKRGSAGSPKLSVTQRVGQFSLSKKLGTRCFGSAAEVLATGYDTTGWGQSGGKCHDYEQEFYGGNDPSYETNVSLRGGAGGTNYYIGGQGKRDNAIQRNTYYSRQSLTANVGQVVGSRLTVRVNNEFVHSLTDRGISGNDNSPVVSPVDIIASTPSFFDMQRKVNGKYQPNPFLSEQTNIFQTADLVKKPEDVFRYIGSATGSYSAYSSERQTLDFTVIGGLDAYQFNSKLYSPPEAFFESADGLQGTIVDNKSEVVSANFSASGAHKYISPFATATTSFGLRKERRQSDLVLDLARNIPSGVTNIQYGIVNTPQETQSLIKDFSLYAQEELLALSDRLLLTGAINAERSSVNGDDKRLYTYPKFAASYRLPWLPRFTDDVKLRVAYGRAGNQPPYGFKFTALPYTVYGGAPALGTAGTLGNPNIRPETSKELEGGLDAQFLSGRASLEATVFRKNVDDLILIAAQAPSSGSAAAIINGGAIKNTGTELGLNLTPIQRGSFTWVSRTTYAKVSGIFTRLDVPGFNCSAIFSLRFGAPYCAQGHSTSAMQVNDGWDSTFVNGVYQSRTRHIREVDAAPSFTMGFANDVTYGPFTVSALLDWRKGGYDANLTNLYFDGSGLGADTAVSNARYARFNQGYGVYLEHASFLKLRELSVSYTLPRALSQRLLSSRADGARLELSGRNLKTWTPYTGYDPEVSDFGSLNIRSNQDVTPYPPSRSVFLSLVANF